MTTTDGDCLIWQGTKRSNGYGVTVYRGIQTTTHRAMYLIRHGALADGMEVDHICNRKDCINPDHLEAVTHQENMQRAIARRSTCKAGHPWNEENTYVATIKRKQGGTRQQRYCRICRAKHQADRRRKITDLADLRGLNNKGGLVK